MLCVSLINLKPSYFFEIYFVIIEGEDVDIDDIKDVVQNMGIELTDKECMELVEKLSACGKHLICSGH